MLLGKWITASVLSLLGVALPLAHVVAADIPAGEGALVIRLFDTEGTPIESMLLDAPKPVSVVLELGNLYSSEHEIAVTLFVDGIQRRYSLNNKEGLLHFLKLQPQTYVRSRLDLPQMEPGFHSVLVLAILEPDLEVEGDDVLRTWGLHRMARRLELTVGQISERPVPPPETTVLKLPETYPHLHGALLAESPSTPVAWLGGSRHLGEKRFFVHLGNQNTRTEEYLVTLLVDWRQVPLCRADSPGPAYVVLNPGEAVSLEACISVPASFGKHPVVALALVQPFSSLRGAAVLGFVEDSHRVYLLSWVPWILLSSVLVLSIAVVVVAVAKGARKKGSQWKASP